MSREGIKSRNTLWNIYAHKINDDVNCKEGAAYWESLINKYTSKVYSC
jgi:hypothetical protein